MGYKDLDKRRDSGRLRQQRYRERQKELGASPVNTNDRVPRVASAIDKRESTYQEFVKIINDPQYRESLGLKKQSEIAKHCHIGTPTYYKWARELGVSVQARKPYRKKEETKYREYKKAVIDSLVKIITKGENLSPRYFELFIKLTDGHIYPPDSQTNKSEREYFDDFDKGNPFDIGALETAPIVEIKG